MKRVWAAVLIVGVVVGVAAGAWYLGRRTVNTGQVSPPELPSSSVLAVPVERTVLEQVVISRAVVSLETVASLSLAAMETPGAGVVTKAAAPGTEVREGEAVWEVDARPVFLLRGERPAYRPLAEGDFGPDVRQLQQAINRLGIGPVAETGSLDAATGSAVTALYLRAGYLPVIADDVPAPVRDRLRRLAAAVADSDDPNCRPPAIRTLCPQVAEAANLYRPQNGVRIPFGEVAFVADEPPLAVGAGSAARGDSTYSAVIHLASAQPVVLVALSPFDAGRVAVGSRAVLDDDPEGRVLTGQVANLSIPDQAPEYGGNLALARVVVEEGGAEMLGRSMRVRIFGDTTGREVMAVPTAAIRSDAAGRLWMDLLQDDETRLPVEVTVGVEAGGLVEIDPVAGTIPLGAWVVVGEQSAP